MGDDGDEARKRMQVKSFTTWVNLHLSKESMEVKDLTKDFEDGIRLIKLIEVISEETSASTILRRKTSSRRWPT